MKILVLGIGNVLYSDEGIGVHFSKYIEKKYSFSSKNHEISFIDGGTLANLLIPIIAEYDHLIVIDCIDADDGEIGDVYFFDYDNMPKKLSWSGSAHEIEMLQTLQFMELYGDMPSTKILGVIPERIVPMQYFLSDTLQNSVKTMEKALIDYFLSLGFAIEQKNNIIINDIVDELKKAQYDSTI